MAFSHSSCPHTLPEHRPCISLGRIISVARSGGHSDFLEGFLDPRESLKGTDQVLDTYQAEVSLLHTGQGCAWDLHKYMWYALDCQGDRMWAHCRAESLAQETTLSALVSVMGTQREKKLTVEAPSLMSRGSGIYPACIVTPEHSLSTWCATVASASPAQPPPLFFLPDGKNQLLLALLKCTGENRF